MGSCGWADGPRSKLFLRFDRFDRFVSALVVRAATITSMAELREKIHALLGPRPGWTHVGVNPAIDERRAGAHHTLSAATRNPRPRWTSAPLERQIADAIRHLGRAFLKQCTPVTATPPPPPAEGLRRTDRASRQFTAGLSRRPSPPMKAGRRIWRAWRAGRHARAA